MAVFTGQGGAKRRPALIISTESFHRKLPDVIVCPISSQPRYFERPGPGDVPLGRWEAVGLRYPSSARTSNLLSVEKRLIRRTLGMLHADDLQRVALGLRRALGLG